MRTRKDNIVENFHGTMVADHIGGSKTAMLKSSLGTKQHELTETFLTP